MHMHETDKRKAATGERKENHELIEQPYNLLLLCVGCVLIIDPVFFCFNGLCFKNETFSLTFMNRSGLL